MDNIIVTTPEALEALISRVLDSRIAKLSSTTSTTTSPGEIIDRDTLRTRLGITDPTIIRLEKKGVIPYLTVGTAKRYRWDAVVKALENKKSKV